MRLLGRDFEGFRKAVAAHAAAWAGPAPECTWLGLPELQAAVLGPAAPEADLLVVPADWLPALAAAGRIRPLPVEKDAPDGWPWAWSESFHQGITWAGQVYGLPFHDGPQLLFTRPSLLGPPATWDELLAAARRLHRPGRAGTVLAGAPDGHNNVYDFLLHLWRFGGDVDRLDSPQARQALEFLREVATTVVPDDAHALDSADSGAEFAAGRVAVMVNWAGYAALAAQGPIAGDFVCSVAPGTTVNAFWVTVLTTDRAWGYLRHAASAPMDLATTGAGASGTRRSTWSNPEVLSRRPEYALFDEAHAKSRPLPRIAELPALVDSVSELVDAVVWRGEAS